ncbi:Cytochrome P450 [Corchorus olitorius]|uniref:Cytochrome P450 n=1 Tax=Corchorus olitorius TaxID=93759 RepID=A0A1R3K0C0_9ROSI|nr:Cytochrome P450 [Corchorus olitorius]
MDAIFLLISLPLLSIFLILTFLIIRIFTGKFINNPDYAPVTGTVFHQLLYYKQLHDYQTQVAKKHPTFRLIGLAHSELYTTNTRNIEHILKTNCQNYLKGKYREEIVADLWGQGIFAVDGERWRHQRKLAVSEFSTRVLRDFSCSVFRKNAVILVRDVSELAASGQVIPLQDIVMKRGFHSIFEVGFGIDLNCLDSLSKRGTEFMKAFDDANELIYWRFIDPLWKLKRVLNIGSESVLKKNIEIIDNFVYNIISTKKNLLAAKPDCNAKEDILSRFLMESKKNPEIMTDKYLKDIILNFMIAGKDSSAVSMSCITDATLDQMHYLHAALTETLRLYPPVPVDGRSAYEDDILPDGHKVKKGDDVYYLTYVMARMPFLWGEDAHNFRPERWLKDGVFQPESPIKFVTFHAGPQICLGKEFTYWQMKIFSIALIRYFRFKLVDYTETISYKTTFTLQMNKTLLQIFTGKSINNRNYAPVKGIVFDQLFYLNSLYDYQTKVARNLRTFRLLDISHSIVYTTDPRNVEHILKTKFDNYAKGSYHEETVRDLWGQGIFAVDGDKWRQQRKLASFEFSARVLRDFSCSVFRINAAKLVRTVSSELEMCSNQGIEFKDLLMKSTMDSMFKVGFGIDLNCLDGSSEEKGTAFMKAFDDANEFLYMRFIDPFWKLKRALNMGAEASLKKNIKIIDDFLHSVISTKKKLLAMNQDHNAKEDILSRFLVEREKNPEKMTDKYIRDIVLNFLIAGKDATSNTLSWFLYMLCKNPLIQEKVAEEVMNNTACKEGNIDANVDDFMATITDSTLEKMHYLHAALTETLRLYPTIPLAGPRICLGREFAYRQMKIFSIALIRYFRFRLADEKQIAAYRITFTLQMQGSLQLCAVPRTSFNQFHKA